MEFKLGYTQQQTNITSALENGTINSGDLIIVDDNETSYGNLVFIKEDNSQLNISIPFNEQTFDFVDGKLELKSVDSNIINGDIKIAELSNSLNFRNDSGEIVASFNGSETIDISLSQLNVYSKEEVDEKIAKKSTAWTDF